MTTINGKLVALEVVDPALARNEVSMQTVRAVAEGYARFCERRGLPLPQQWGRGRLNFGRGKRIAKP